MGLFSWFSKKPGPADFEGVLARLATEISEAKLHLSEVRLRERRYSLLLNAYGVGLWAIWVGLWWFHSIPWSLVGWNEYSTTARLLAVGGVIAGPIVIWLLNRLLWFTFRRVRTNEETHLRLLMAKQRKQVEEIKELTNFETTRKLLELYDSQNPPSTPQRGPGGPQQQGSQQRGPPQQRPSTGGSPSPEGQNTGGTNSPNAPQLQGPEGPLGTPRAPGHLVGAGGTPAPPRGFSSPVPVPPGMTPEQAFLFQAQVQAIQPVLPTPEKKWYDRLADSILGDDPSEPARSKYALVCAECFRHNGLIGSQHEWERLQWICPRCNHLNPPPLSRMHNDEPSASEKSFLPDTPSKPAKLAPARMGSAPTTPSRPAPAPAAQHLRASPRPRRQLGGERTKPRSSRLSTEVFSAADEAAARDESEDTDEDDDSESMEVDTET